MSFDTISSARSTGLDEEAKTDKEDREEDKTETESDEEEDTALYVEDTGPVVETGYVENITEELGQQGDAGQTEEVADENKSLIWSLVKQVRVSSGHSSTRCESLIWSLVK